jgi:hypothetical protein
MDGRNALFVIIIVIIFIGFTLFNERQQITEAFQNTGQYVVCFLCVCPTETVLGFAEKVANSYQVFIVCDDINCQTPQNTKITFIRISDDECKRTGWTGSNIAIDKVPSAWDKALYYFSVKEVGPAYVWFIEEDVFVPNVELLMNLDKKYPDTDLIAKQNVKEEDDPSFDWWFDGKGVLEEPLYRSLVCATRVSRKVLYSLVHFVNTHKRLAFIEIIFNTIVFHENMTLAMPEELQTIIWRHNWVPEAVDKHHMFHPVKDTEQHDSFRDRLEQIQGREN